MENWCDKKEEAMMERAKYGVARQDCWNFDEYFFKVLSNVLKIYKAESNGTPVNLTVEEYDKILDRMIFLCAVQTVDVSQYFLEFDTNKESWEHCQVLSDWRDECKDELFDLLKEHIRGIWW